MQALARGPRFALRQAHLRRLSAPSFSAVFPSRSVCKATIVGRTGRLPDFYEFDDDSSVLTFDVATTDVRVVQGVPDSEEITQWNRVQVQDNVPGFESVLKTLGPGSLVYVEGALRIQKEKDPEKPYSERTTVRVTRNNGIFRVLKFASRQNSERDDGDGLMF